jgi:hypothetical protein
MLLTFTPERAIMAIAAKLDEWGKGAWLAVMIAAFVVFWPAGLAILAYIIWSGRMGCMHHYMTNDMRDEWRARREQMHAEWRAHRDEVRKGVRAQREDWRARKRAWAEEMRANWFGAAQPTPTPTPSSGNAAFDEYKAEALRRLEEEQAEFTTFLENLRKARDKAEFDQFMQNRRDADRRPEGEPPQPPATI